MNSKTPALLLACLHILSLAHTTVSSRGYDYSNGTLGPSSWGNLRQEWSLCGSGSSQSPVNLTKETVIREKALSKLVSKYEQDSPVSLVDLDNDIALEFLGDAGHLEINGSHYQLWQTRVHAPSEHMVDHKIFPAEVHLIHNSTDGSQRTVIVAYYFKLGGKDNEFIDQVLATMNQTGGIVDPTELKVEGRAYFTYSGSLTSPPCSEGVIWYMLKKNRRLSKQQHNRILDYVNGGNARPLQPINERTIESYK